MRKYSPQILTGLGIVGGLATTVSACKATTQVEDILEEHKEILYSISMQSEIDNNAKKELAKSKVDLALKLGKLYLPTAVLGASSVICILGAHGIMNKRNAALAMVASVAEGKLREYRDRVIAELGEDKDKEFLYGTSYKTDTIEIIDEETGKKKKAKVKVPIVDENGFSQYAKCFDDASPRWVDDAELNLVFLRAQQNYANDLLNSRGHIFLNEVYDMLGIPRTKQGTIVGWVKDDSYPNCDSDGYVDFGIYTVCNEANRDFINGYNNMVFLDFNVDGVIYDLI